MSEIRWIGFGKTPTQDGNKIWFSGDEKQHQHEVAFIVRKVISHSVISFNPISSRLISICVSDIQYNMTIIQAYTPILEHDDKEVEEFYELLQLEKSPGKTSPSYKGIGMPR